MRNGAWLAAALALAAATGADAGVALVTARAALGSDLINWGATTGGPTPVGFVSTDGIVGTTTSAGGDLQVRLQPANFDGNFNDGDYLEFTGVLGPDITLNFDTAVAGAGAQIQSNFPGTFVARITASDGTNSWSFTETGFSNSADDGSAIFIGVLSDAANLKWVSFQLDSASFWPFSMAINQVSLTDSVAGVPEPASWTLMIAGFAMAGAAMRRRIALSA
jgi:hypothetical protein